MRRAQRRKYHYFYKTTCLITNRYYYGIHSTDNLDDGYIGSGKKLWYSLNKYGRENHICEKLEFFENRGKLIQKEIDIVNKNLLKDPMCMNLQLGGSTTYITGWTINFNSDIQQQKSVKAAKKRLWLIKNDEEWTKKWKTNISEGVKKTRQKHWYGKKHSIDSIQKMKKTFQKNHHQQGEKNSQYETCWITNGKENKKINKNNLIPNGWKLGRNIK